MKVTQIIKASISDANSVVTIFNSARAGMTYLPVVHTPDEIVNFFTSLVENGTIWIAKIGNKTVGFMEIKDGWLNHLYILPEFQNQGVGKEMLDIAKQLSPNGLFLMVFENNKGAIQFYEREGFVLQEKRSLAQTTNEEHLPDRKYYWN